MSELIIKPWAVSFEGQTNTYFAKSRGAALAACWRAYCSYRDIAFREFLRTAAALRAPEWDRFGEKIKVGGKPAYLISLNSQYMQFVRPGSADIHNTHPLDVEPPEARRGTPYYTPAAPKAANQGIAA